MLKGLIVGLGGFLGAISRYGLVQLLSSAMSTFPLATLVANISGSFLISLLVFSLPAEWPALPYWRELLVTGFLGSLTTMSTFMLELYQLSLGQALLMAVSYGLVTLVAGLVAVYLGHSLALWLQS